MPAKWIGFLVFVWVVALLLGAIPTGAFVTGNTTEEGEEENPAQGLMSYLETWSNQDDWASSLVFPISNPSWLGHLFNLLVLNFPSLFGDSDSPFQIIRWLIVGPIIGTVVFGMIILFSGIFRRPI